MTNAQGVVQRRRAAHGLSFEELEERGWCECGQLLVDHDPLPRVGKFRSWREGRDSPSIWARNRHLPYSEAQVSAHRRARDQKPNAQQQPLIIPRQKEGRCVPRA